MLKNLSRSIKRGLPGRRLKDAFPKEAAHQGGSGGEPILTRRVLRCARGVRLVALCQAHAAGRHMARLLAGPGAASGDRLFPGVSGKAFTAGDGGSVHQSAPYGTRWTTRLGRWSSQAVEKYTQLAPGIGRGCTRRDGSRHRDSWLPRFRPHKKYRQREFDPREVEPAGLAQEAVAQLTAPYVLHARTHKLH